MASVAEAQITPMAMGGPPPANPATVYRDAQGVPHIVAPTEAAAWYALGYEQARDGLLWIQYACKAAKGELTWALGNEAGLANDVAVKVLGSHLGGKSTTQLRQMFAPQNPAVAANFYDNCMAFAAGANAYRERIHFPPSPSSHEGQLKSWFDTHSIGVSGLSQASLSWVYEHPIDPKDIASQGGWVSATWSMFQVTSKVVNSIGSSFTLTGGEEELADPELVDPRSPELGARLLEELRQHVRGLPGGVSAMSGSNSFGWSGHHCKDSVTQTEYPGLLADPHQGLPFYGPDFAGQFTKTPNHMWFAHVQVKVPGALQPSLDVFGHMPHAAAAFFSSHNRTLAVGGTAGAPDHTDRFVLRLLEGAGGAPAVPHKYYSYYHDPSGTNTTYQDVTEHSMNIKRFDGTSVPVPYWRAQSFGFILPDLGQVALYIATYSIANPGANRPTMPVVYGERVEPTLPAPAWRARVPGAPGNQSRQALPKMRFWQSPQLDGANNLITSPMVVTVRSPMDASVAGEGFHWMLMRNFWEISHASTVTDVIPYLNGPIYNVNVCIADTHGSIFTTQLSKIPERGDDAALQAALYSSLDKVLLYNGGAGPVPARHSDDRKFDWQFGSYANPVKPAPLRYLEFPPNFALPSPNAVPFKAATLQIASPPQAFPPTSVQNPAGPGQGTGQTFKIESGLFASVCNDQTWGYSRKTDKPDPSNPQQNGQPGFWTTLSGYAWRDIDTDNYLLDKAIEAGCAYQSPIVTLEAPDQRQNIVVERFTRQAQAYQPQPSGWALPPLTPAQMREFVVSPRLFHDPNYVPPPGATANIDLPTPIRQLREVLANPGFQWIDPQSQQIEAQDPVQRADQETRFLRDLWNALVTGLWSGHVVAPGVTVDLYQLWALGGDPTQPAHASQVFWYDDPSLPNPNVRWIDMPVELPLIDFDWSASELGHGLTVGGAWNAGAVLGGAELSYLASVVARLEAWDPSVAAADRYRMEMNRDGARLLGMFRMGYNAAGPTYGRHWMSRRLLPQGATSFAEHAGWKSLRDLAFPPSQGATLLKAGLNPPYAALYVNPGAANPTVKSTLSAADTNALVRFFLELGGHYMDPAHNNGSPSRKLARWQAAPSYAAFFAKLPGSYPLTGGLERITVLRRLLDTDTFLATQPQPIFRARAYDHTATPANGYQHVWPDPQAPYDDVDCVGDALRSVEWFEDESPTSGHIQKRGLQPKFLGMAGSYATLLTMFPWQGGVFQGVQSYFWCTPGVQAMGNDLQVPSQTAQRFDLHMQAYSSNVLMQSHFGDFLTSHVSVVTHYY